MSTSVDIRCLLEHKSKIRSTISSIESFVISFPSIGQCGRPIFAYKKPQIVVNFRHRPDGRARIVRRRFLVNRNRRAQAFDRIHVRFFHLPQKLPGIARQTFEISPLSFGKNGVKSQRRLPRPADSREHDKLPPRKFEVNVL